MKNEVLSFSSVKDGVFRFYRGSRDKDSFISFIEEKKWKELEPVPGWKSPGAFHMSIVAGFFRISMSLKVCFKFSFKILSTIGISPLKMHYCRP